MWGTLDPVAAYLLARGVGINTRTQAEKLAQTYYDREPIQALEPNEQLDARRIRDWVQKSFSSLAHYIERPKPPAHIDVELTRNFKNVPKKEWRVIPIELENEMYWLDPGGFKLAKSLKASDWQSNFLSEYDFILNTDEKTVTSQNYI